MSRSLVVFVFVFAFAFLPFLAGGQGGTPPPDEAEPCPPAETMTAAAATPEPTGSPTATPEPTGSPTATPVAEASCTVAIVDNAFEAESIKVAPGTTVIWTNESTNPNSRHTVTSDEVDAEGKPIFDSGSDFEEPDKFLAPGMSFSYTFDTAGEYPYYCAIHGGPGGSGMSGTVIVEE
jgi:plastocyanin